MNKTSDNIIAECCTCKRQYETMIVIETGDLFNNFCSDECGEKYYKDNTKEQKLHLIKFKNGNVLIDKNAPIKGKTVTDGFGIFIQNIDNPCQTIFSNDVYTVIAADEVVISHYKLLDIKILVIQNDINSLSDTVKNNLPKTTNGITIVNESESKIEILT